MTKSLAPCLGVWVCFLLGGQMAHAETYSLEINRHTVNITGNPVQKVTVNGSIPAPTLELTEGEEAVIHVTNKLDEPTSIHWHGLLIDPFMDGVPSFNGFYGIPAGQTFTYRFKVRQSGTYWYHAHSKGQEQEGLYGSIIAQPADKSKEPKVDRDYVIVLSDFTEEHSDNIMANLKMSSDYYAPRRQTIVDFFKDADKRGLGEALTTATQWGEMRMMRTDLSDVTGYTFLVNGKSPAGNWTGLFKAGERVRLRFINASAMSFFDVRIPHLKMNVIQADGQNVEPFSVDEFRFAPAETYDVIVTPQDDKAYTIVSEPIDRTGFALATLAPRLGMKGEMPQQRERALLRMGDMGGMDMADMEMTPADMKSGWAETGMPKGQKALSYKDLRYDGIQKDTRKPERTIDVRLGGNMERYIWTINDKKFSEADPIRLKYGERVRLKFTNETMMAHPMHLHGMFVQLENGQPAEKLPNKHTVIVAPGKSYSVLLTADEAGEWAFHCHLLYHMMSGMMTKVVVAQLDEKDIPVPSPSETSIKKGGHHAHH